MVSTKGYLDISTWPDLELVNTKSGWESLCIVSGSLLSGTNDDCMGNLYLIPQTMAGLKIDVNSEELLNQVGGIFKPDKEAKEDYTLQAALSGLVSAQLGKLNNENRGASMQDQYQNKIVIQGTKSLDPRTLLNWLN